MLSYQHLYHAGNLADVHKHALLAVMLDYLTQKPKPLSYIETHAGRGLYDLSAPEAVKTGEAAAAQRALTAFAADHPYTQALSAIRSVHGPSAYPGSPLLAAQMTRAEDRLHLAELHPGEHIALKAAMRGTGAKLHQTDGFALAASLAPPTPRRGLLLIDPSYEVKADYAAIPNRIAKLHRAWNVGVIALWYPILTSQAHRPMRTALRTAHPAALVSEVQFAPARPGHGMVGSGLFVLNPPYPLAAEAARLERYYAQHLTRPA
ncbi:MAG: 23S rRNA (adenine(2030)-N(6))-methyltransferase RlmJ [Pseudomonadota bacterium]